MYVIYFILPFFPLVPPTACCICCGSNFFLVKNFQTSLIFVSFDNEYKTKKNQNKTGLNIFNQEKFEPQHNKLE